MNVFYKFNVLYIFYIFSNLCFYGLLLNTLCFPIVLVGSFIFSAFILFLLECELLAFLFIIIYVGAIAVLFFVCYYDARV
jgi:NADH:ubiquinone oxidoreductase subunit 6 (subunit J)